LFWVVLGCFGLFTDISKKSRLFWLFWLFAKNTIPISNKIKKQKNTEKMQNKKFSIWAAMFHELYGENAMMGIAWVINSCYEKVPPLFLYGKAASGKSSFAHGLLSLWGRSYTVSLGNGTTLRDFKRLLQPQVPHPTDEEWLFDDQNYPDGAPILLDEWRDTKQGRKFIEAAKKADRPTIIAGQSDTEATGIIKLHFNQPQKNYNDQLFSQFWTAINNGDFVGAIKELPILDNMSLLNRIDAIIAYGIELPFTRQSLIHYKIK
jgi:hypothetical protein